MLVAEASQGRLIHALGQIRLSASLAAMLVSTSARPLPLAWGAKASSDVVTIIASRFSVAGTCRREDQRTIETEATSQLATTPQAACTESMSSTLSKNVDVSMLAPAPHAYRLDV